MVETFQNTLQYVCVSALAAIVLCAALAFVAEKARLILSRFRSVTLAVWLCIAAASSVILGSDKTNGVLQAILPFGPQIQVVQLPQVQPVVPPSAPPLAAPSPRASADMPFRARAWNRRGAWNDSFRCAFPGEWVFPHGTGHLDRVEVCSQGCILPRYGSTNVIASIGVPLQIVNPLTSFGCGPTDRNSYVFSWTNAVVGRVTREDLANAETVNASIELFRNGDVAVTTNGVTELRPRELPFPRDGYGQDDEWVTANFTNATEILAVGYPQWVDAQVGEGLTNGLYKFTATVPDDPPETIQLVVGDYSVAVTNAGEYVFLLEKGVDYEYGTVPFMASATYSLVDDVPQTRGGTPLPDPEGQTPTWSVDGGWYGIAPQTESALGRVMWLPLFFGSPYVAHVGPGDGPVAFTANFADCRAEPAATYSWSAYPGITVQSPDAKTTAISFDSMPSWAVASVSVTATFGTNTLVSVLGGMTYGTNDVPQVSLGICAPNALFINDDGDVADIGKDCEISGRHVNDDDIIPVVITIHSDVPTNGTITIRPIIRDGHLWKDEDRMNEVLLEEHVYISDVSDFSATYFLECEYQSYHYGSDQIQVVWTDDDGHNQQVIHEFSVVDCVAEPITSECVVADGLQYVVNPCCAIIGSNTFMRVHVAPADMPDGKIKWRVVQGSASFPNGDTGRDVVVVAGGEENDTIVLEVDVDGCPGRRPRFELLATCMTDVLIYPYVVSGAPGAELSQEQLNQKLEVVNMIYRQVGLHFYAAPIVVVNNYEWSRYGLAKRAVGQAIRDYEHKTDGIEVYFIGGNAEVVDYDCKAVGRANSDGIVVMCQASGRALAHEIGHVCRLGDVYIDANCMELYGSLRSSWMPDDWNNGTGSRYYGPGKCLLDVIPQILMFGVESDANIDIPEGAVRGLSKDRLSTTGLSLGQAAVGRNTMLLYPPHTK